MVVIGEQLDMVDQAAVLTANTLGLQRLLHGVGVGGQRLKIVAGYPQAMLGNQEEPVAAPGDIAGNHTDSRHL
ncbi:hypothetical protein D3C76_1612290 [compost metagenome]